MRWLRLGMMILWKSPSKKGEENLKKCLTAVKWYDSIPMLRVGRQAQRTLTNKQQCNPEKFQEKISESVFRTRTKQNSKTVKISQSWFWSGKNFYSRVWSWLRMNAGGVLNTCKSNGLLMKPSDLKVSGGRVSNAWVTCHIQGDNT